MALRRADPYIKTDHPTVIHEVYGEPHKVSDPKEQDLSPEETVRSLGEELLNLNASAYRLGYLGLAYHLLSAALHCAQGIADHSLADAVRQRAEAQRNELDLSPDLDPTSPDGLHFRNAAHMFENLAVISASVTKRIRPPRRVP